MNASFYMPTRVHFGRGALQNNKKDLALGNHAFIVTGKTSAKRCGALDDIIAILDAASIGHTVFDEITENPPILTCHKGGALAAAAGADFVIGIGGGSPLDAAKAIAAYAANPTIAPEEIYDDAKRVNPTLPLYAVPTTSGTGSEANP